jgi:hypothetical protein
MARTFLHFFRTATFFQFSLKHILFSILTAKVLSIAKPPYPLQLILVISVENRMLSLSLREYTWHATKTQIPPKIVPMMGPKSCPRYFAASTHKLYREVRPSLG